MRGTAREQGSVAEVLICVGDEWKSAVTRVAAFFYLAEEMACWGDGWPSRTGATPFDRYSELGVV